MGCGETVRDGRLVGITAESFGLLAAWVLQTGGTSHSFESSRPSLVNRVVVTKEGTQPGTQDACPALPSAIPRG